MMAAAEAVEYNDNKQDDRQTIMCMMMGYKDQAQQLVVTDIP